jgi:molecular chaperone HscB
MTFHFPKDHFELFALPVAFDIDGDALDRAYRRLQREVHPDRFAAASATEQRLAAERATLANEAYQTLKSPLARGRYLLRLNGVETGEECDTAMPADFLSQQLEWREAVAAAAARGDAAALDAIAGQIRAHEQALFVQLREELAQSQFGAARLSVRKLRFIERLNEELADAQERIGS